ncbi:hypothetical protein ACI65C_008464 [Semiaphis heraclei]
MTVVGQGEIRRSPAPTTVRSPAVSSHVLQSAVYASDEDVHGNTPPIATQPPTATIVDTTAASQTGAATATTNHGGERTGEPPLRWCRLLHRDAIAAAAGRTAGNAGASDHRPRWTCSARHHHVHTR